MTSQLSAMDAAMVIAETLNTLGAVASTPAFARMLQECSPHDVRRGLLDCLAKFLQVIVILRRGSSGGEQFINAEPAIQEMERRVKQWQPDEQQVHELTEQARVCLSAMGINTPPGGWDALAER